MAQKTSIFYIYIYIYTKLFKNHYGGKLPSDPQYLQNWTFLLITPQIMIPFARYQRQNLIWTTRIILFFHFRRPFSQPTGLLETSVSQIWKIDFQIYNFFLQPKAPSPPLIGLKCSWKVKKTQFFTLFNSSTAKRSIDRGLQTVLGDSLGQDLQVLRSELFATGAPSWPKRPF